MGCDLKNTIIKFLNDDGEEENELVLVFNLDGKYEIEDSEIINICNLIKGMGSRIHGIITGKCAGIATLFYLSIYEENRYVCAGSYIILNDLSSFEFDAEHLYKQTPKSVHLDFYKSLIYNSGFSKLVKKYDDEIFLTHDKMLKMKIAAYLVEDFYELEEYSHDEYDDEDDDEYYDDDYEEEEEDDDDDDNEKYDKDDYIYGGQP